MNMRSLRRAVVLGRRALRRRSVGLAGGAGHEDEAYAQLVLAALREKGPLPLEPLIEYVAQQAMQADRRAAGEIDIGLWGSQVYRTKIAEVVRRMVGRSLALEGDESSPAATPILPAA
jgi:hypothetical protein